MSINVYYDKDADLSLIKSKKVAILGYGSQGHAHALNLKDSGVDVTVALRKSSKSWAKAESAGLKVSEVADAVKAADLVMILAPDQDQRKIYEESVAAEPEEGRRAGLRAWLQHPLPADRSHAPISTSS